MVGKGFSTDLISSIYPFQERKKIPKIGLGELPENE
jgi:hypothetical protein